MVCNLVHLFYHYILKTFYLLYFKANLLYFKANLLYFSYYIIKFFLPNSFWHVLPNFLLLFVSLFFASLKLLNQKFLQNKMFTIDIMALVNRYGLCVLDMPTDMFRLLWWRIKRIHSTLFHKKNGQRRYKYLGKDQLLFCNKNTLILTKSSPKLTSSKWSSFWLTTYLFIGRVYQQIFCISMGTICVIRSVNSVEWRKIQFFIFGWNATDAKYLYNIIGIRFQLKTTEVIIIVYEDRTHHL